MCSCGVINKELTLKDRKWTCKSCGVTHNRDRLAAQNILNFAFQKQNMIGEGIAKSIKSVEHDTVVSAVKQKCK